MSLKLNSSGGGSVTLQEPVTANNQTLTLPDSTGTIATAESTLSQFNASGSAPVYACRAWVNFNGTGTVAIRASGNVTSITDNGTGEYTVNFTTAMPDANYSAVVNTASSGDARAAAANINTKMSDGTIVAPTTTALRVGTYNTSSNIAFDSSYVNVSIFR